MKQSKESVLTKISEIIEEVSLGNVMASSIKPEDRLIQDLHLDSLDYASVMLGCERWLGIKVVEANVRWSEIQSVKQLADFIHSQQ